MLFKENETALNKLIVLVKYFTLKNGYHTKLSYKMSNNQLKASSICDVPFQSHTNDFTFIVNGKEFQTSKLQSDLLSYI